MQFVIKILFSGMLAFIPNETGTQLDVLFLNVGHEHAMSDGTAHEKHMPIVAARAGTCTGDCPKRDAAVAAHIFGDKTTDVAKDSLEAALAGGGAWQLGASDLSLRKGSPDDPDLPSLTFTTGLRDGIIPTTSAQRADYSWLASLKQICPGCGINPAVLGSQPPSDLVVARLRLNTGNVHTAAIARIGTNVTPVHFKRLDGEGTASAYTQAISSWMGVDIPVSGNSIELVETRFDGTAGRTMKLTPDANGKIELAMLQLPKLIPVVPTGTPGVGKHWQEFYRLTATPPPPAEQLVPQAGPAPGAPSYPEVTWQSIHEQSAVSSELLDAIRLGISRSAYEVLLCPPGTPWP